MFERFWRNDYLAGLMILCGIALAMTLASHYVSPEIFRFLGLTAALIAANL